MIEYLLLTELQIPLPIEDKQQLTLLEEPPIIEPYILLTQLFTPPTIDE